MADSLLVLVLHEQTHGALSIREQAAICSPHGPELRAVKNVLKLITNSPCAAKIALMAREAGADKAANQCQWAMHLTLPRTAPRPIAS